MRKIIKFNKKIILIIIILLVLSVYIYNKNNNYEEIENISDIEDVIYNKDEQGESLNNKNDVEKDFEVENIDLENETKNTEMIIVHITGEVNSWGVIELESGSRIIDAVNKAGGFTENADTNKVNLAYELSDGIKIYIPSKTNKDSTFDEKYITENSGDNVITEETKMKETKSELININSATQTELETLPGIGPSIALKIISFRKENGSFSSIEDIKNVSGIGESKFDSIKELICVK